MARLRACVQPYQWLMIFPREGLCGTVAGSTIRFSRFGSYDRFGHMYQFTGTLKQLDSGTALVGDVRVKWYFGAPFIAFACFFGAFIALSFAIHESLNGPPWPSLVFVPVWFIFVFGLMTLYMRRNAEGTARYIALVVGNAFSQSPPGQFVC
jgi:hypothetical protein